MNGARTYEQWRKIEALKIQVGDKEMPPKRQDDVASLVGELKGRIDTFHDEVFPLFCKGVEIRLGHIEAKVDNTCKYQQTQNGAIADLSARIWYLMGGIGLLGFLLVLLMAMHEHIHFTF